MDIYQLTIDPDWVIKNGVSNVHHTDMDYLAWVAEGNTPTPYDPVPVTIAEAKAYLAATDYKMLPDYTVAPDGEALAEIVAKRATARELVRSLS